METRLLSPIESQVELPLFEDKNFIFTLSDDTLFRIISYFNDETTLVRFAISCKYVYLASNRYIDTDVQKDPELKNMWENVNKNYDQFIHTRKKQDCYYGLFNFGAFSICGTLGGVFGWKSYIQKQAFDVLGSTFINTLSNFTNGTITSCSTLFAYAVNNSTISGTCNTTGISCDLKSCHYENITNICSNILDNLIQTDCAHQKSLHTIGTSSGMFALLALLGYLIYIKCIRENTPKKVQDLNIDNIVDGYQLAPVKYMKSKFILFKRECSDEKAQMAEKNRRILPKLKLGIKTS